MNEHGIFSNTDGTDIFVVQGEKVRVTLGSQTSKINKKKKILGVKSESEDFSLLPLLKLV